MKKTNTLLWCAAGMLCAASASAQLYKSVGTDGRITYSDTPPASAARIEQKTLSLSPKSELPGELAQVVKAHPVTLYTTSSCKPCEAGRNLLTERGIPYAEKTVQSNEDLAVLRQVGGDRQLPLLTIGNRQLQGLETDIWQEALTAAGYPIAGKLPKTYQHPAPVAAAWPKPEAKTIASSTSPQPAAPAPKPGSGFRF